MAANDQQIVVGITVSNSGQATVAPSLSNVLFDYALTLEEATDLPVDVEHVLAALVLASRKGDLPSNTVLTPQDSSIPQQLIPHIRMVFQVFGGEVGNDD